ncbi:alpha/beta hydrolase [Pseudonocardia phyllosphaerae]|uniref:alpha/beta hydrolase n=1 Tax=Pseudonocardia phyllosphaerae TaxID=3390502 RepID=UPI00397C7385
MLPRLRPPGSGSPGTDLRDSRPPRRRGRTSALVAAGIAALVLAGGCADNGAPGGGAPGGGDAPPPAPGAPAVPAGLEKFYDQKPKWGPCKDYASSSDTADAFTNPQLDCTRVEVPKDYAHPDAGTMQIALLRKKASGKKIGSLFTDPGGPGGSGTAFLAQKASDWEQMPIGDRFDLIGFDPRGTGASLPAIRCQTDREVDEQRARDFVDPSPKGVAAAEDDQKKFAEGCTKGTGADVLANVGTRDVAKDMDVMRATVGDQKMTYAGFSYGTELGTAYAEAFPQNVRALLLDGAIDPEETTVQSNVKQAAGFQVAFDAFAKNCTKRPNCPLGTDPAKATGNFQKIMQRLITKPVPVGDGRTLGFTDALNGANQALYVSQYWSVLEQGISGAASGDGRILKLLSDSYYERDEQGHYSNMLQAFQAISCVNNKPVTDPADVKAMQQGAYDAAPFRQSGKGAVLAKDACAFWPVPPTSEPHTPKVQGLPPIVVVSVTGDPATPYQAGVNLAQQLGGGLIKVNGNQHTASLQGDACTDKLANDYLVDLKLPKKGAECTLAPA